MNRTITTITILAVLLSAALVYSQEIDGGGADTNTSANASAITSIEVIGLKRTRPFVVKNPLEKFLGTNAADFDNKAVIAEIEDLTVVAPVSAKLVEGENGYVLSVTVKEKWSIIPVPMVLSSKTGTIYGGGVMESNFLGTRDMALVGAVHGPFGWYATAVYNHTPRRNGLPGGIATVVYGTQEREAVDKNETLHRRYMTNMFNVLTGVNYSFTDELTGMFITSFTDLKIEDFDDTLNVPENGAVRQCFNPSITWRKRTWDGYFLSSKSISLDYNYYHAFTGTSYHQPVFRVAYEQSIVPGFRLVTRAGGVWKSEDDPLLEEGQTKAQVSILPSNFSARNYAGGFLGFEKYLHKSKFGMLAAAASWQGVYYEGSTVKSGAEGSEFNHGPTLGMSFYLARLALPAMGIVWGYNMDSDKSQISLSLGASF